MRGWYDDGCDLELSIFTAKARSEIKFMICLLISAYGKNYNKSYFGRAKNLNCYSEVKMNLLREMPKVFLFLARHCIKWRFIKSVLIFMFNERWVWPSKIRLLCSINDKALRDETPLGSAAGRFQICFSISESCSAASNLPPGAVGVPHSVTSRGSSGNLVRIWSGMEWRSPSGMSTENALGARMPWQTPK